MCRGLTCLALLAAAAVYEAGLSRAAAVDDEPVSDEPQATGWPLTEAERAYVLRPEYERRPGSSRAKHLPALWPVTPSAGYWTGTAWLDNHARLVESARAARGPVDVLLVGDSLTAQWGDAWAAHFPLRKAVNLGVGGDKTQNVLWRLDHGGADGLEPRLVVLMIGNNNMYFTPETGTEAAAKGVRACADRLRRMFPAAPLVVAKILPAGSPGDRFYQDIRKTNADLDALKLDADPKVHVLDLWPDAVRPDGTLKPELFTPDRVHLTPAGYALYARRLAPLVDRLLGPARP